jgi:oligopeptidase B
MLNKKNTFKDFISVGKYLIANNYTSSNHLYGYGGSAGGLLIGAVINMEPELFNGVISAVPFVDVLTTMLDDSIPLTTSEYSEWGNPNEIKYYDYIKSYCPYSNVEAKDYPNILVTTGLHDSQVQYFEPAKWVAKLRELKTDENLLLMKIQMEAGHSGATGRFKALREVALDYAFLLHLESL